MEYPLIGVSGSVEKDESKQMILRAYFKAVCDAGGIPVLLSLDMGGEALSQCLQRLDGLLLAGGNDIDPRQFGESPAQELGEVNPLRDRLERELVKEAVRRQMPLLGICRGIQAINAALGGTLYQDLPTQYRAADGSAPMLHVQTSPGQYFSHDVTVKRGTKLFEIAGAERIPVNSFHHQAVKAVAPGLTVSALSEDGLTEAVEAAGHPFLLGVQWHPERTYPTDAPSAGLFAAFVQAARAYRNNRSI